MAIWNILRTFGILYFNLVHFVYSFGTFFSGFGNTHQEKSGNPGHKCSGLAFSKNVRTAEGDKEEIKRLTSGRMF
jgi:hypothetical protein